MKPVVSAEYLLAELRCAALRARLWQADIEAVGVALRGGLISPEQAVALLVVLAPRILSLREWMERYAKQ
jgi:hypothetical protein